MNIISFPRSGQHLTENILKNILNARSIPFSYCEYYTCCKNTPCVEGKIFQKNHDFGNNLQIQSHQKYLVLYRVDPILQLEAYYRFSFSEKYSKQGLLNFYNSKIKYYNTFINKWVKNKYDNVLSIEYYDLCNNTFDNVVKILNFYYPDVQFDYSKIQSVISGEIETDNGRRIKIKNPIKVLHHMDNEIYQYIKNNRDEKIEFYGA